MLEKEFIPYQEALSLKELGFNEPCLGSYCQTPKFDEGTFELGNSYTVKAPLYSQAFRWFREKHSLQGYVYSTTVRGNEKGKRFSDYCWHINGMDMPFLSTDPRDMEKVTYEEAELECLRKLIKLVKNKE